MQLNVEKKTSMVLWMTGLVMVVTFILGSLGSKAWLDWITVISGIMLGLILLIEAGVLQYIKTSAYKKIGLGDFIVLLSTILGTAVLIQSILRIPMIGKNVPSSIITYLDGQGIIIGIMAALLLIYHAFTPRPR